MGVEISKVGLEIQHFVLQEIAYHKDKKALPDLEGRVTSSAALRDIEIYRDKDGVPHIITDSYKDALLAMGYVHATDRLWQMEMARRLGSGRLSEVLGTRGLEFDKFSRTLGWKRVCEAELSNISKEQLDVLEMYATGVNLFIEEHSDKLAMEFKFTKVTPEPWTPLDSLMITRVLSFKMSYGWQHQLVRARLEQIVGEEHSSIFNISDEDSPNICNSVDWKKLDLNSVLDPVDIGIPQGQGSNAWAIHGSRTASGSPILCNDPHLQLTVPSNFYQVHVLVNEKVNITGVSVPGTAGIIAGHNEDIAWGISLGYADTIDLYVERVRPNDQSPQVYVYGEQEIPLDVVQEEIRVKGEDSVILDVMSTCHGPIISGVIGKYNQDVTCLHSDKVDDNLVLSYCSQQLQVYDSNPFDSLIGINLCKNVTDFRKALLKCPFPSLNVTMADRDGNIGYGLVGSVPIRPDGDKGLLPKAGWVKDNAWKGSIPLEELPFSLNPPEGYIVSCNQRVIDDDYPYYLGSIFRHGYRASIITDYLKEHDKVSVDACEDLQMNVFSTPGDQLRSIYESANLDLSNESEEVKKAYQVFMNWDRKADVDSSGCCVYAVLFWKLADTIFNNGLQAGLVGREDLHLDLEDMKKQLWGVGFSPLKPITPFLCRLPEVLINILGGNEPQWWLNQSGGLTYVLTMCLVETSIFLENRFGSQQWRWGELHKYYMNNPWSAKLGGKYLNSIPIEMSGSSNTVNVSSWEPDGTFDAGKTIGVCWRMVCDLGDMSKARSQIVPGQSGRHSSEFYNDRISDWASGTNSSMLFTKDDVMNNSKYKQTIQSTNQDNLDSKQDQDCIVQ